MAQWRLYRTFPDHKELINMDTGAIRKVPLASDKQFEYLNSLRSEAGLEPLKHKPPVYSANKAIDKLLIKTRQAKLL